MRALANYVMRGPAQAAFITVLFGLLGVMVAPLWIVSGAAVGLVTLARGRQAGWQVVWRAMVAVMVVGVVLPPHDLTQGISLALAMVLMAWGPLLIIGGNLRRTEAPSRSLLLAGLLSLATVVGLHAAAGDDPVAWWGRLVTSALAPMEQTSPQVQQMEQGLVAMAPFMAGFVGWALLFAIAMMLLLARWWQALLYNPGGFGQEFRQLRLGRPFAILVLVLLAISAAEGGWMALLAGNILIAGATLPLLQGIAVVHGLVAHSGGGRGWLIGMYTLIVLMPQTVLLLILAGALDNWFDFRVFFGARDDV